MPQFYSTAKARLARVRNMAKSRMREVKSTHCCKIFLNSLMALLSRILYFTHAVITVWRVTEVLGVWYWTVAAFLLILVVETCIVVFQRGGKEWKWFQPCILIYLMVELPSICMLELEKASQVQRDQNATVILHDILTHDLQTTGINVKALKLSNEWWSLLLNQSMMILLIIARWLMPKGDLTRDQLSGLLLYYLGTASDIVDFFSVLAEDDKLLLNWVFIYTILVTWSWSMVQFIFVVTMTHSSSEDQDEENEDSDKLFTQVDRGRFKSTENLLDSKKKLSCPKRTKQIIMSILASEAWAISVSMVMQDGPFAVVRVICLFYWGIRTYTNYFFTFKNVLVLALQIYRLVAVYEEHKKSRIEEEKKKERKDHLHKAVVKAEAVSALSGGFKRNRKAKREDTITEISEDEESEEDVDSVTESTDDETDYEDTYRTDNSSITTVSC